MDDDSKAAQRYRAFLEEAQAGLRDEAAAHERHIREGLARMEDQQRAEHRERERRRERRLLAERARLRRWVEGLPEPDLKGSSLAGALEVLLGPRWGWPEDPEEVALLCWRLVERLRLLQERHGPRGGIVASYGGGTTCPDGAPHDWKPDDNGSGWQCWRCDALGKDEEDEPPCAEEGT